MSKMKEKNANWIEMFFCEFSYHFFACTKLQDLNLSSTHCLLFWLVCTTGVQYVLTSRWVSTCQNNSFHFLSFICYYYLQYVFSEFTKATTVNKCLLVIGCTSRAKYQPKLINVTAFRIFLSFCHPLPKMLPLPKMPLLGSTSWGNHPSSPPPPHTHTHTHTLS